MQSTVTIFVKKFTVLLLTVTFLFSFSSYSQVPSIPQEVRDLLPANVDPSQMSKSNLESYFQDKNQQKQTVQGVDLNQKKAAIILRDSLRSDYTNLSGGPNSTYGENIFQNAAMFDIGELSTPPLDYPIGVGDHIIVALWGGGEFQNNYEVAKDGSIFPASLGKINVQGLTFENARSLIYSRFRSVVPATTNIQVTLGQPRTINVNVAGEVKKPGPVTVSAFSNAFNIIGLAGGLTEYGNLREIQVKRNGRVIESVDVYKYLNSGDIGHRIYLQNNDFVLVTFVDKKVMATGQFKRPMFYQLKKNEGIKDLIRYSGGFTTDAFSSGVKVIRNENEKQVIHDVNFNTISKVPGSDYLLFDGDIVKADLIKPGIVNKIELKGEVKYPGVYELKKSDRLFDIVNRAGGITPHTYLRRAFIFRGGGDSANIKADKLEVNLEGINKNLPYDEGNIQMQANDIIQFFSVNEFDEQQYVEIFGEVRKEAKVKKYGGMTLQDLIYLSGGLKQSAEFGRLEISSIVDIDSAKKGLKPTRTIVKSYAVQANLDIDSAAQKVVLKPYDQIFVRKNPTFELQQNVQVLGLVKYEGIYPKLNKHERLSSYITRAGGILENANIGGAILYRRKTDFFREKLVSKIKLDSAGNVIQDSSILKLEDPVSIDLYKAMKYKNSKHDIILQQNDLVYIPEINPFVTVGGKVQSPLRITFDKEHTNLSYYIDRAGGFGVRPWRKRIFVTYANGISRRTKNLFFIHFYPKIEEGCTITVPEKIIEKDISNTLLQGLITTIPVIVTTIILRNIN